MKSIVVSMSLLAATMAVSAQIIQSRPFSIRLNSEDKSVDGQYVGACHSGAAIESLCLSSRPVTMHFNTTTNETDATGLLTWYLPGNLQVDSAMRLLTNPSSNVAPAMFYPGNFYGEHAQFDKDGHLVLLSGIDDTKDPIVASEPKPIDCWYVCDSYVTGYRYKTLSWVYGNTGPQNPTCVKVTVTRKFD
ncbi:hypothetical protein NQ176_g2651 [Zarea fungicola]|uniref:Uncharacterized protein n=1 Tax=Zarea fungicola TaxID=93591 RepID=A0ACC1NNC4_9HYPO|nr:hypothetical protein NQ176_g2651 [Lecanicillium fungicola]